MTTRTFLCCLLAALLPAGCSKPRLETRPSDRRIISLAPNVTEIIGALGGGPFLVGRTSACDYPPDLVRTVPIVGGFGAPSMELLISSKPSLILYADLSDESIASKISALGLRQDRIRCRTLDDIPQAIVRVGSDLGLATKGQALASIMADQIRTLRAEARSVTNRPTVYVEIWGDPLVTAGRTSFLSELVFLAGGRNIGDEADKEYFEVAPEWVISRHPDVILCLYMSGAGRPSDMVVKREAWSRVPAILNHRVYDRFDNNMVLRPGPRVLQSIRLLRECIGPRESGH